MEDIDRARCRPEFEADCLADLAWLGVDWDEGPDVGGPVGPYRQSERIEGYDAVLAELTARGAAYACRCSRAEVRAAQSAPHHIAEAAGELPYPGACRPGPGRTRALHPSRGGLRLDVEALGEGAVVRWRDVLLGPREEDVRATCGDFLLGRPGQPSYQLAVVADDIAMGITDVVRGRDLDGSTARQVLLHRVLGAAAPRFHHHPLILDGAGRKLSKRDGDLTLSHHRAHGVDRRRLVAALGVAVGLFSPTVARASAADFAAALAAAPPLHDGVVAPMGEPPHRAAVVSGRDG